MSEQNDEVREALSWYEDERIKLEIMRLESHLESSRITSVHNNNNTFGVNSINNTITNNEATITNYGREIMEQIMAENTIYYNDFSMDTLGEFVINLMREDTEDQKEERKFNIVTNKKGAIEAMLGLYVEGNPTKEDMDDYEAFLERTYKEGLYKISSNINEEFVKFIGDGNN